jgi:hypothetical protein
LVLANERTTSVSGLLRSLIKDTYEDQERVKRESNGRASS